MTLAAKIFLSQQSVPETAGRNGRQTQRRPLSTGITVRDSQLLPLDAEIVDLSSGGCLIIVPAALDVPSPILIGIAGLGRIAAQIVRHDGGRYGCAFDAPLSEQDVARANAVDTVVPFATSVDMLPGPVQFESTMPDADRWPVPVRVLTLVAAGSAAWALVLAVL